MPLPPLPRTTTCSMSSARGSPGRPRAWRAASCTCSGSDAVNSNMPTLSSTAMVRRLSSGRLEGGVDPLGRGFRHEPLVLGVIDRLGFIDQHDRYVLGNGVAALEPGVVQAVLV